MTGKPLSRAIVWDNSRTCDIVTHYSHLLKMQGVEVDGRVHSRADSAQALKELTGLPLSTYFSAIKLRWMIDNWEDVHKAHEADNLVFGTIESWIAYTELARWRKCKPAH